MQIAILGSGLAAKIHSNTLKAVAPHVPRWYASRDPLRAQAAASKFGGTGHFGSYESALASRDIDVAIIGLPPALHLEWTLRALEAGKHVIVEKPPFLDLAEFDHVEAVAARAGRQVLVAENYFYKPLTRMLRTTVAEGDLGDILFIQLTALKGQRTRDWRDNAKLAGGGALFEGGIHWVSLLANIGLTPERIRAGRVGFRPPEHGAGFGEVNTERSALVTIEYAEGAVATLFYSWDLPGLINGVRMSRIYGTRGVLRFETNGIVAVQSGARWALRFPGLSDLAGYRAMMSDFLAAIGQGRPPEYNLALARRDLQLIEQAHHSLADPQHT